MFGIRISRRFIIALGGAVVGIATDPYNLHAWMVGAGLVLSAAAGGVASSKQPAAK